jgi:hypothetical protein
MYGLPNASEGAIIFSKAPAIRGDAGKGPERGQREGRKRKLPIGTEH